MRLNREVCIYCCKMHDSAPWGGIVREEPWGWCESERAWMCFLEKDWELLSEEDHKEILEGCPYLLEHIIG